MGRLNKKNINNKRDSSSKEEKKEIGSYYISFKKQILFLVSLFIIFMLTRVPFYREWYQKRIKPYYKAFEIERKQLDLEKRKISRYGKNYVIGENIRKYFTDKKIEKPVLLVPPKEYLKQSKEKFDWGESLQFYYFHKIRIVTLKDPLIYDATHILITDKNNMNIIEVQDSTVLNKYINEFKKIQKK